MDIGSLLTELPIISDFDNKALAKLVTEVSIIEKTPGDTIYDKEDTAETLYYVVSGTVELLSGKHSFGQISSAYIGEEAALKDTHYRTKAVAKTKVTLLCLRGKAIQKLIEKNTPSIQAFHHSLLTHFAPVEYTASQEAPSWSKSEFTTSKIIGWILAIIAPFITFYLLKQTSLPWIVDNFIAAFSAMIFILMFNLAPLYVPIMYVMLVSLVLGLAPSHVILRGFTSNTFFMTLSLLALGAVIKNSGLFYRFSLYILSLVSTKSRIVRIAVFLLGVVQTPFLTSSSSRTVLVAPLISDLVRALKYKKGDVLATALSVSVLFGAIVTGSAFLTGKTTNFILFGLLPLQEQQQMTWVYWFLACSIFFFVMVLGSLVLISLYFKGEKNQSSDVHIELQLKVLGKVSKDEWIALAGIGFLMLGLLTTSLHSIPVAWIAFAMLYLLLAFGILSNKNFRRDIDWPFLFFLGGLLGIANTASYLHIDKIVFGNLGGITYLAETHKILFINALFFLSVSLSLFFNDGFLLLGLMLVLAPVASSSHISLWLIGFVILIGTDVWFFPYQNGCYLMLERIIGHKNIYNKQSIFKFNLLINILRYVALLSSIPLWKLLGLM